MCRGTRPSTGGGRWSLLLGGLLGARAVLPALAQRAQRRLALVARGAVQHEHTVEVVDLVLQHAGLEPRRLDLERLALDVDGADAGKERSLHVHRDPWQAKASLLGDLLVVGDPLDRRVRDRGRRRVGPGLEDEETMHDAELGGSEADADRVAHDRDHPPALALEPGPEGRDLRRPRLQHRVAELADVLERCRAAAKRLLRKCLGAFVAGTLRLYPLGATDVRLVNRLAHGFESTRLLGIDVNAHRHPANLP